MKKQLITVDVLERFICRAHGKVYVDGMTLLTPGARDALSKQGIAVVHGARPASEACYAAAKAPEAASCPPACAVRAGLCAHPDAPGPEQERLLFGLAAMLKSEYGITDPETLREISLRTLKVLRDTL